MALQKLWNQIQTEMIANRQKAAILGVLFLIGCCVWVPMAVRALSPRLAAAGTHDPASPAASSPQSTAATADAPTASKSEGLWDAITRSLEDEPLYLSANVETLTCDPFHAAEIPIEVPAPVIEVPVEAKPFNPTAEAKQLKLHSTIIGRTRRAAMINGQIYHIGKQVEADGRKYSVSTIESHRVVLSSGDGPIELTLPGPKLIDVLVPPGALDSTRQ